MQPRRKICKKFDIFHNFFFVRTLIWYDRINNYVIIKGQIYMK